MLKRHIKVLLFLTAILSTLEAAAQPRFTGPGAAEDRLAMREMGGRQLTDDEAAQYTVANIFSASSFSEYAEDWLPADHCPYKY